MWREPFSHTSGDLELLRLYQVRSWFPNKLIYGGSQMSSGLLAPNFLEFYPPPPSCTRQLSWNCGSCERNSSRLPFMPAPSWKMCYIFYGRNVISRWRTGKWLNGMTPPPFREHFSLLEAIVQLLDKSCQSALNTSNLRHTGRLW